MGIFSELFSMAASEVTNAVVNSYNEFVEKQNEKERLIEEYKEKYTGVSYETLIAMTEYDKIDTLEVEAIKILMNERDEFANRMCTTLPDEVFCEFDDDTLVEYYIKFRSNDGAVFSDKYANKIVRLFCNEVMTRYRAKMIYADKMRDCFDEFNYDSLEGLVKEYAISGDLVLKEEAEAELKFRNSLIEYATTDKIDELDNDEFMDLYNLVRQDKTRVSYDDDEINKMFEGAVDNLEYSLYNKYFGSSRSKMLECCEKEFFTDRKYLLRQFIEKYCEDEFEKYSNYSNKKLKTIVSQNGSILPNGYVVPELEEYDMITKIMAESILDDRGGE